MSTLRLISRGCIREMVSHDRVVQFCRVSFPTVAVEVVHPLLQVTFQPSSPFHPPSSLIPPKTIPLSPHRALLSTPNLTSLRDCPHIFYTQVLSSPKPAIYCCDLCFITFTRPLQD